MATTAFVLALLSQAPAAIDEGRGHERDGRWRAAIEAFARVPDPAPLAPGAGPDAWSDWNRALADRWDALYRTAVCLLRLDRPAEALATFRRLETQRLPPSAFSCGNAPASFRVRIGVGEGICLERLGRPAEALNRYLEALKAGALGTGPGIALRLVALYRLAGREDALREELVRIDAEFLRKHAPPPRPAPDLDILRSSPARPVRAVLEAETKRTDPRGWVFESPDPDVPYPPLPKILALPE